ncbi:MAG: PKD domain-containing protein [Bacteroidales bacterium]|nr:PKD domain-containing protein [Bacteroidales bacterium]
MKRSTDYSKLPKSRFLLRLFAVVFSLLAVFAAQSQTYYWVGGTGDWNQLAHWSTTDPTTVTTPAPSLPDQNTDVVFVDASFTSSIPDTVKVIDGFGVCRSMTWNLGAGTATKKPWWNQQKPLSVYGHFILHDNLRIYDMADIYFKASSGVWNIDSRNNTLSKLFFEGTAGTGGEWKLLNNLVSSSTIYHNAGTLNFNGKSLTSGRYSSTQPYTRTLLIGNSTYTLTATSTSIPTFELSNCGGFTYSGTGTSLLYFSSFTTGNPPVYFGDCSVNYDRVRFRGNAEIHAQGCSFASIETAYSFRYETSIYNTVSYYGTYCQQTILGTSGEPFANNQVDLLITGTKNATLTGTGNNITEIQSFGNISFNSAVTIGHLKAQRYYYPAKLTPVQPNVITFANTSHNVGQLTFPTDIAIPSPAYPFPNAIGCDYTLIKSSVEGSVCTLNSAVPITIDKAEVHDVVHGPGTGITTLSKVTGLSANWDVGDLMVFDEAQIVTPTPCYNSTNGTMTVIISGIRDQAEYQLQKMPSGTPSTFQASYVFGSLGTGTYKVTYREKVNGVSCTAASLISPDIIMTGPDTLWVTASPASPLTNCPGSSDAVVTLTAQYGNFPPPHTTGLGQYQFSTDNGTNYTSLQNNPYDVTGLAAATYNMKAKDPSGCVSVNALPVTVTSPPAFASAPVVTQPYCNGGSQGSLIDANITGGTAPYVSYLWSDAGASTTENLADVPAGSYTCTVTDNNSCSWTTPAIVVGQPAVLNFDIDIDPSVTPGLYDASVINRTGGTGPFAYSWTLNGTPIGGNSPSVTDVAPGTLCCTVTDNHDPSGTCQLQKCVDVQVLDFQITGFDNIDCYGQSTGQISVEAAGGSSPYTYIIEKTSAPVFTQSYPNVFSQTFSFSNLPAGSYTVKVKDADNVELSLNQTLTQNAEIVLTPAVSNVLCYGGSDGSVDLTIAGGVPPFVTDSIRWFVSGSATPLATGQPLTGQPAGNYDLLVSDNLGCDASLSAIVISQPAAALSVAITSSSTNIMCPEKTNGTLVSAVTGGTLPYTYIWKKFNPAVPAWEVLTGTDPTLPGQSPGQFRLVVVDLNGCIDSASWTVAAYQPAEPSFFASQECHSQMPLKQTQFFNTTTLHDGYWQQLVWTFEDGVGNVTTVPYNRVNTYDPMPLNELFAYTNPAEATASLYVKDNYGCEATYGPEVIDFYDPPVVNYVFDTVCLGEPTSFTDLSTGGNGSAIITREFSINGGGYSQVGPVFSNYFPQGTTPVTLRVRDANSCLNSLGKTVAVASLPQGDFEFNIDQCTGEILEMVDISKTTYPTNYPSVAAEWRKKTPLPTSIWFPGDGNPLSAPWVASWNTPGMKNIEFRVYTETEYTNTYNNLLCASSIVAQDVEVVPVNEITALAGDTCLGDPSMFVVFLPSSISLGDVTEIEYNYGGGTPEIIPYPTSLTHYHTYAAAGLYNAVITVRTALCEFVDNLSVTVHAAPNPNFEFTGQCEGNTTTLIDNTVPLFGSIASRHWKITGPMGYLEEWDATGPVFVWPTVLPVGNYVVTLTVTDGSTCSAEKSLPMEISPAPVAGFTALANTCHNYALLGTPPVSGTIIEWAWTFDAGTPLTDFGQNISHTFPGTGSYNVSLTIKNSYGCYSSPVSQQIDIVKPVVTDIVAEELINCGPIRFTATSNVANPLTAWTVYDPNINPVQYGNSIVHSYPVSGTYPVEVTILNLDNQCESDPYTENITVHRIPDVVEFDIVNNNECMSTPITFANLTANTDPEVTFNWTFTNGTPATWLNSFDAPVGGVTFSTTGPNPVTLTVGNSANAICVREYTESVVLKPEPDNAQWHHVGVVCPNAPITLKSDATVAAPSTLLNYSWVCPQAPTLINYSGPNDEYTFNATAGVYTIIHEVTTSDGCVKSEASVLVVEPGPTAAFIAAPGHGNICPNDYMLFVNQSSPISGITCTWEITGDPLPFVYNGLTPPPYFPVNTGDKTVTLTVVGQGGCPGTTYSQVFTVFVPPTADFTTIPADTVCQFEEVTFVNTSTYGTAGVAQAYWYYGDIPTIPSTNTQHAYANPGDYSPTLIVEDLNGCSDMLTKPDFVTVEPLPVVSFHPSNPTACSGTSVEFIDDSYVPSSATVAITAWFWEFINPSGTVAGTSTSQNATFTFPTTAANQTWTIQLTATSEHGCEQTTSQTYTVYSTPLAGFSYAGQCLGNLTQFTNQSNPAGNSWVWNFGDGSPLSNFPNPPHVYDTAGTYPVSLVVTGLNGCADTIQQNVTIHPLPTAQFIADSVCFGDSTHFNNTSLVTNGLVASSLWQFNDPFSGTSDTSTLMNPSHLYTNYGNYNVLLTVTDTNGCMNDTILPVLVHRLPQSVFSFASATCLDTPIEINEQSVAYNTSVASWHYNFGDGNTATLTPPPASGDTTYTYTTAGNFVMSLVVTDGHGCSDSAALPVTVWELPQAGFTFSDTACYAPLVYFNDTTLYNNYQVAERRWIFDLANPNLSLVGTPGPATVNYVYPQTGQAYQAVLLVTDQHGCTDSSAVTNVMVNPGFDFTIEAANVCLGSPAQFSIDQVLPAGNKIESVTWLFDEFYTSNDTAPEFVFESIGYHQVEATATDTNGCSVTKSRLIFVQELPLAIATASMAGCTDSTLFTSQSVPNADAIAQWHWFFGDGTDSVVVAPQNPEVIHGYPATDSTYTAALVVLNTNGCSDSVSFEVHRFPCLMAEFDTSRFYCQKAGAWFADQSVTGSESVGIVNWDWDFGDGSTLSYTQPDDTVFHSFVQPGAYTVQLVITALVDGIPVTDTARHQALVLPAPQPDFTLNSVCEQSLVQFDAIDTVSAAQTIDWQWIFDDGTTQSGPQATYLFADSGFYQVYLKATSDSGCIGDTLRNVQIFPLPELHLTPSSLLVCADTATIRLADTSGQLYTSYWWDFGDQTAAASQVADTTHFYEWGSYTATLTATSQQNCVNSDTAHLTLNPLPVAVIDPIVDSVGVLDGEIYFSGINSYTQNAILIENYYWYFDDGRDTSNAVAFHTFSDTGYFNVKLYVTDLLGCTGVDSITARVYPEKVYWMPTAFSPNGDGHNEVLKLRGKYFRIDEFVFQVFNRFGAMVFESLNPEVGWDGNINGEPAPSGMYVVKFELRGINGERASESFSVMLVR